MPASTARSVRSSSQSISSSAKGATLRGAPELSDPVGSVEVREHQDVEKLGAGSRPEGVEAFSEAAFEFIWPHRLSLRRRIDGRVTERPRVQRRAGLGPTTRSLAVDQPHDPGE
jgi:hypothetical protein